MNGQILPIDAVAFETSNTRGTIVDTGTTLTYLVKEAYDPFLSAVSFVTYNLMRESVSFKINDVVVLVSSPDIKQRVAVGNTDHV